MNVSAKSIRCAIYTRKSTEDGLEQEFNSLHAQREACEAYIISQRHEGWTLVPDAYDDGGYSGGTMQRPGLKALMKRVEEGLIDVIVVYKVDRLTRSLADFAKIVEILDERQASFVSITQAFNTTSSMGRLTLNVLLSFAQFEREVTGERIRDKIAASKKKGLWMGGPVPLGYVVKERKLIAHPEEAQRVRSIMRRYLANPSAPELLTQLESEGVKTKIQQRTSGPHRGGIAFRRGSLFHLLKNPIYRGKIVHKGEVYDGEHEPIVDQELWDAVQAKLKMRAPPRKRPNNDPQNAMLKGLLFDMQDRPMVPTYTAKQARRYRYYETRRDLAGPDKPASTRYAMARLDKHVIDNLKLLLDDQHAMRRIAGTVDGAILQSIFAHAKLQKDALKDAPNKTLQSMVSKISINANHMTIEINPECFGLNKPIARWAYDMPLPKKKPFREAKLKLSNDKRGPNKVDPKLIELISDAMKAQKVVLASPDLSMQSIAKREGRCRKQLAQLLKLSWLSPRIIEAISEGTQPSTLTRQRLMKVNLPMDWNQQEHRLGFTIYS